MKKGLWVLLCTIFLVLSYSISVPVLAWNDTPLLVDDADLLTDSEESALLSRLEEVSRNGQTDIVVVTAKSLNGEDMQEYADDFYDESGYAEDGVLLLISIDDSEWYISTAGFGITAVTDAGREYMAEQFLGKLSAGEFFDAFMTYADLCDEFIRQAQTGKPYDVGHLPKGPFPLVRNLLVSLGIGLVAAFIMMGKMRGELKTVNIQAKAENYVGSLKITRSKELFLYTQVKRQEREKETSSEGSGTHTSSSGSTHGGGGGSF